MRNSCIILLISLLYSHVTFSQSLKTLFETSEGKQSATYQETISFYEKLQNASSGRIKVFTHGTTDIGKPLHLVVYSQNKVFDPQELRNSGKAIFLINNAIHPGEPDGVDASMLLLRNILQDKKLQQLVSNTVLLIIPFYNIDGALNRNSSSRANQNGPEAYGFRGNYQNLDLNRDFIKTDSKNSQTFQQIYHLWQPDVFLDTHVSNGADYQYTMTYIVTQPNKLGGELGNYLSLRMVPKLEAEMKKRKVEMTPYVNHFEPGPVTSIIQFLETPRYSTGYTALFGSLGFITETHMLKPYKARVAATYEFITSLLLLIQQDRTKILQLHNSFRNQVKHQKTFPLAWQYDEIAFRNINFKGYSSKYVNSEISGLKRLKYDRSKPFTKIIPFYNVYKAKTEVSKPYAYVIPQAWHKVIHLLKLNGLELQQIENDTSINVESYYITGYQTIQKPYEGHYLHYNTQVKRESQQMKFYSGDYLLIMNQENNRYAMETLEPQATDSYFNWNFFDSILQQKEGFSDYVFEDIALQLLKENPELRKEFDLEKSENEAFAEDHDAQLDFIYKRSSYYEKSHNRYPVYRIIR